jgi:hypothetical protein
MIELMIEAGAISPTHLPLFLFLTSVTVLVGPTLFRCLGEYLIATPDFTGRCDMLLE